MESAKAYIRGYARAKSRLWLGLLLLYSFVLAYSLLQFAFNRSAGFWLMPMSMINFGLHETAHAFTMGLPPIMTAASGSLAEIAFGILIVLVALKLESLAFVCYALLWVSFACIDAGIYMADAVPQRLDLFSPFGDNVIHDWHFVFNHLNILSVSKPIGIGVISLGVLCALGAVSSCGYLLIVAIQQHHANKPAHELAQNSKLPQSLPSRIKGRADSQPTRSAVDSLYPTALRGMLADYAPPTIDTAKENHDHRS